MYKCVVFISTFIVYVQKEMKLSRSLLKNLVYSRACTSSWYTYTHLHVCTPTWYTYIRTYTHTIAQHACTFNLNLDCSLSLGIMDGFPDMATQGHCGYQLVNFRRLFSFAFTCYRVERYCIRLVCLCTIVCVVGMWARLSSLIALFFLLSAV